MKTKYLFYSLALAGAFAACSQEELIETPALENNDIANRPVAGVVEFTAGEADSRFAIETGSFEAGDVFGLYLMDEFVNEDAIGQEGHKAEHNNANGTYWKYQNHWFGMYNFTKSIQSNYPFTAVKEGNALAWKNDAKLVEGNYFAMYPQNEKALNRRELWHSIDPTKELVPVSTSTEDNRKFQNVENQFFLGYKQIYRDATASAEGTLKMNMPLKGVMVPLQFVLENLQLSTIKLDKISFKNKSGKALPTLAYINPTNYKKGGDNIYGNWVVATGDVAEKVYCSDDYKAIGFYNESATWTKQTIMNLVDWEVPGTVNTPYGLTGEAKNKAYEYSFTFPDETIMESKDIVTVYVVVPAMNDVEEWSDLQVDIYAWEQHGNAWEYRMLAPKSNTESGYSDAQDNYSFNVVDKIAIWNQAEESKYWSKVDVRFDQFSWKPVENTILTAQTADMEKAVLGRLAEQKSGPIVVTVTPDASGVEVTKAFLDQLTADSKDNGRPITLKFEGTRHGSVEFNEDGTMLSTVVTTTEVNDYVSFMYGSGIVIKNNAEQTVDGLLGDSDDVVLVNGGAAKLNVVDGGDIVATVENNGEMSVIDSSVGTINNYGGLTLMCNASVTTLNNLSNAVATIDALHANGHSNTATVNTLNNSGNHGCNSCYGPTLNVKSGTLAVTEKLDNGSKDAGAATLLVAENAKISGADAEIWNYSEVHNGVQYIKFENKGTVAVKTVYNYGVIDNLGAIGVTDLNNNAPSAVLNNGSNEVAATLTGNIANSATINTWLGTIETLKNIDGTLNVWNEAAEVEVNAASDGTIVYKGVVASHVDVNGYDEHVFEVTADDETLLSLIGKMQQTGATTVKTAKNIVLTPVVKADGTTPDNDLINYLNSNVKRIYIEGTNVVFKGVLANQSYSFNAAEIEVKAPANGTTYKLSIENATKLNVASVAVGSAQYIHVAVGSSLEAAAGSVDHNGTDVTYSATTGSTEAAGDGSEM